MAINVSKVVVGGLVAGVVANVCDTVWGFTVMQPDMVDMAKKFGTSPDAMMSMSGMLPWIMADFVIGLVIVWNYAAIRPRFGPGPKTALVAALPPYTAVTAVLYGFTSMGMMTSNAFAKGTLTSLVSVMLASLAGAFLYKED
jgi:hypothetical protein